MLKFGQGKYQDFGANANKDNRDIIIIPAYISD